MFWPDGTLEMGRQNLSVALSSLRHQLEPPGTPAGAVLVADRQNVGLNPAAVTTDVAEFEAGLRAAIQTEERAEKGQVLAQALNRYQGRLLQGYYDDWIVPEQERLAQAYFQAASQLVALLETTGEFSSALEYARRALSRDPLREEAHVSVMRLLAKVGQPAAALMQYRELERLLDTELGDTPSPALQELARQIARQPPPASPPFLPMAATAPPSLPARATQPTGTVTFLLTDVEGSTALWQQEGEVFKATLDSHNALIRQQARALGGYTVKEAGDGFLIAFAAAGDALACALACQRSLASREPSPSGRPLRVRMALHTGDIEVSGEDYRGQVLHRVSRLLTAAHGEQTLCSEATATLLRRDLPAGVSLRDLGLYRLRDVPHAERVFQVQEAALPHTDFPPLHADRAHSGHLPLSFTRFFGRETEIATLSTLLLSEPTRLVTLTGPGGTGKTRLALEVGRSLVEPLAGAVWFVPLADLSEAGLLPGAIVEALGLSCLGQVEPLEQVVEALSRQPALLVLDNMEQLVEEGALVVQTLLERVPSLTLLVTSRQLLGLSSEREFAVPTLPTPQGSHALSTLTLYESVQLFVDRAQTVRPDFQVTHHNAPGLAELCDRLEGIPLALELAAARAQVLTPSQMLLQMAQRFDFLVSRKKDVALRHRTLKSTIDWSYALLAPNLQRFFVRLSVFRGGWTSAAAEAVCTEPLALDLLAQLRECSLVLASEEAGSIRFRMLDSLREYGGDRLKEGGEKEVVQARHGDYFLALAEEVKPKLLGGPEQGKWLDVLEQEHDNLRVAVDCCLQHAQGAEEVEATEKGLRLGKALLRFWMTRGYLREGRERLTALLALPSAQGHTTARADALNNSGWLACLQGDYPGASALFEESLLLRRELGDRPGIAVSLNLLGMVVFEQGDSAAATSLFEESLLLRRELGDKIGSAAALASLGNAASVRCEYAGARLLYEESLALFRRLEDKQGISSALVNLGNVAKSQSDYAAAHSLFEESLLLRRELGDKRGIAHVLASQGSASLRQGEYAVAHSLYEESLALFRELGDRRGVAEGINGLGIIVQHQGDYAAASSLYEESLAVRRELGDKRGIANSLICLASLRGKQGDYSPAHACLWESLTMCKEYGEKEITVHALEGCAELAHRQHRTNRAARLWGAAHAFRDAIGAPLSPRYREETEHHVAAVRKVLGEEAFRAAWAEGQTMTVEQAIEYALEK